MANNDLEKFLAGSGLNRVWEKVFSLVKILTGDVDVSTKGTLQKQLDDVRAIANGRKQGKVFATTDDMKTWLQNSANAGLLNIGDNLYIVEKDVPDWWISGVLTTADSSTGYFYTIEPLEGPKIDLSSYDTAISKLNEDISALSGKMTSFESTKSDFVSSSLGQSLGLTTDSLWSAIVTAIKNVVTFLSGSQSVTTSGKWGMSTKNGFWLYIPNNGYYKTDHQLNIPWDTIKDSLGYAAPEDVYIGKTFSSREGVKLTGTMPGFKAGDSAAVTDSKLWGIGTTSGVWMYIPKDGWYSNKYWLQVPWGTLKNFLGNADASRVLSGYTFTSQNGIKLTGTYKYGVQVTSMTVTSDASTTPFYEGDGTTTVNYNWFYIPLSSIGNHMLCGLRYNKHGVSSGGWEYAVVNPGMIVSLINTGYFIDLTKNQTDVKTSSKPWFPCWEPNTKYDVTVYYVNM